MLVSIDIKKNHYIRFLELFNHSSWVIKPYEISLKTDKCQTITCLSLCERRK